MTPFALFEAELLELCRKYRVQLKGYEGECNAVMVAPVETDEESGVYGELVECTYPSLKVAT